MRFCYYIFVQSDLMAELRKVSQERDRLANERKKFKGQDLNNVWLGQTIAQICKYKNHFEIN